MNPLEQKLFDLIKKNQPLTLLTLAKAVQSDHTALEVIQTVEDLEKQGLIVKEEGGISTAKDSSKKQVLAAAANAFGNRKGNL